MSTVIPLSHTKIPKKLLSEFMLVISFLMVKTFIRSIQFLVLGFARRVGCESLGSIGDVEDIISGAEEEST